MKKRCLVCDAEHSASKTLCDACRPSLEHHRGTKPGENSLIAWVAKRARALERRKQADYEAFLVGLLREARKHVPAGPVAELIDRHLGADAGEEVGEEA